MWAHALKTGLIHHKRLTPVTHDLSFKYWGLVVPIVQGQNLKLPLLARMLGSTVRTKDHGPRDGSDLYDFVHAQWAQSGISVSQEAAIFLTCFPRQIGFDFNPLSVYWAWEDQELVAVLFEVRNTVGGMHHYAFAPDMMDTPTAQADKVFYVSPFIANADKYAFHVKVTDTGFHIGIDVLGQDHKTVIMKASQSAVFQPYERRILYKHILRRPAQSWGVMRDILWHALCLKIKGAPYHSPKSATYTKVRSHRDESLVSHAQ